MVSSDLVDAGFSHSSSDAYYISSPTIPAEFIWIADSGASEHMTDKRGWFIDFQPIPEFCWSVNTANDHKLWVRGTGDILVHSHVNGLISSLRLKNVLYVPELRRNLVSVSQFTPNKVAIVHVRMSASYFRSMVLASSS